MRRVRSIVDGEVGCWGAGLYGLLYGIRAIRSRQWGSVVGYFWGRQRDRGGEDYSSGFGGNFKGVQVGKGLPHELSIVYSGMVMKSSIKGLAKNVRRIILM